MRTESSRWLTGKTQPAAAMRPWRRMMPPSWREVLGLKMVKTSSGANLLSIATPVSTNWSRSTVRSKAKRAPKRLAESCEVWWSGR